ncbi:MULTISPECIES: fasciclin domain-containing protein [Niastella]|uniref:Fasciclin domain-containing protein n=1 Tax=Niastella soli TaxID=2821487 RepID=A0ABS3Z183_9BACT|nr:fasciclin domain-containing protein [Niastella soli]MBO9203788.1 fasciclin domain-containing protein [Niastella soli]
MKNLLKPIALTIVIILIIVGLPQCNKMKIVTSTTDATNLVSYLEKYPDTYSEFIKVLEKSGTASFMNAYGTYTMFAPTNDAIQGYLQDLGKSSLDDISADDLKTMVRYHVLEDTISTPSFTDGKLPVPTMHGEYLITGINNENGVSRYIVNRRAIILQPNIHTGNGILHSIDHVLIPSSKSLYQRIKENPNYSIFTEALEATGLNTVIQKLTYKNDTTPNWYTVLAQSNAVYAAQKIYSFNDLKAKYTKPNANIQDPKDSLNLYVAYHILTGLKFTADLVVSPAQETLAPQEVITTVLKEEKVLLNYETANGVTDSALINRPVSDIACTNGVLHDVNNNLYIKVRNPTAVYWDVAEQPEIMKLTSIFRKGGKTVTFQVGDLKDVTWNAGTVEYFCNNPGAKDLFYWNDRLALAILKPAVGSANMNWIEFTTPLIIKGRYKVWICWRSNANTNGFGMQTWIDGYLMPRLFSFGDYNYGKTLPETDVQAQGWKRYYVGASTADHMASKLIGTVEITTTGRHKIKFITTEASGQKNSSWLDMIHFIPEGANQFSPKFATDGSIVY